MKWFVTDAQLAALRATAAEAAWADYRMVLARLREDRAAELARVADPSAPFVAHLLDLVTTLRRDGMHERQRAEVAIDQCRATHLGIGPVTLPPRPESAPMAGAPSMFTDPELAAMGNPDGI